MRAPKRVWNVYALFICLRNHLNGSTYASGTLLQLVNTPENYSAVIVIIEGREIRYLLVETHFNQFQVSLTSMHVLASGRIMQGVHRDMQIKNIQISLSDGTQRQVGYERWGGEIGMAAYEYWFCFGTLYICGIKYGSYKKVIYMLSASHNTIVTVLNMTTFVAIRDIFEVRPVNNYSVVYFS